MKLLSRLAVDTFGYGFCIEPVHSSVLGIYISRERNMLVAEKFISHSWKIMENILYILMEVHGMMKHVMSWD